MATPANWFDHGGADYARYRPDYPDSLGDYLAGIAPDRAQAVDVGCGSGQLTALLARRFAAVVGLDPSADQLAHAAGLPNIRYRQAPAEALPLPDGAASLVTAAQAAHWFDLPAFYAEVRRIARPGAVLALISYGALSLDPDPRAEPHDPAARALHARFERFYRAEIGPWWPPERALVDSGYAGIDFPFAAIAVPALQIRRHWPLADLLGYVATWSAVRRAREAGQSALLARFGEDLTALWGDPAQPRAVAWPIALRVGRISGD